MLKKDILLKLLQQLDQVQKKAKALKMEGKNEEALTVVKVAYKKLLSISPEKLDEAGFISKLTNHSVLGLEEFNVLAELLKEEGDLYYEKQKFSLAKTKYEQSLALFDYLNREEKVFSFEREAKTNLMQEYIKSIDRAE